MVFGDASLHDANNYGGKETTGTSLFVYGLAWGMRNGILNQDEYLTPVKKAWQALSGAVHKNGFWDMCRERVKSQKIASQQAMMLFQILKILDWAVFY